MTTSAPSLAAATAWLAPLPPKLVSKCEARTVSPQAGMLTTVVVRSILVEPMTPMRGRFGMSFLPRRCLRNAATVTGPSGFELRGLPPDVDAALDCVAVDLLKFVWAERQIVERLDAVRDLLGAARADQGRGHALVSQRPGQRHLRQRLATPLGDGVELTGALNVLGGEHRLFEKAIFRGAAAGRDAGQIFVGEQALREWRKDNGADALGFERIQQMIVLDPAIDH